MNNSLNEEAHKKYLNDSKFKQLVDVLQYQIAQAEFTPTELRQAVIFACILYEERTIRPFLIPKTTWHLTDKHKFDNEI